MFSYCVQRLAKPSRSQLPQPWHQYYVQFPVCQLSDTQRRYASISSAINGGKYRSQDKWSGRGRRPNKKTKPKSDPIKGFRRLDIDKIYNKSPEQSQGPKGDGASSAEDKPQQSVDAGSKVDDFNSNGKSKKAKDEFSYRNFLRNKKELAAIEGRDHLVRRSIRPPNSLPYASPESQFVYGASAVLAALKCRRRKLNVLYLYDSTSTSDEVLHLTRTNHRSEAGVIRKHALLANVKIREVAGKWLTLMDRMSKGRPHNGFVLDASPLPQTPTRALTRVGSPSQTHFKVDGAPQTEEEARINGSSPEVPRFLYNHPQQHVIHGGADARPRYPFIIMLQGITDSGNVGAIIRSAYYFGTDAVVLTRGCAPMSPHTMKASSGAAENMPLMMVSNTLDFIAMSRKSGWKFFAADAPSPPAKRENDKNAKTWKSSPSWQPSKSKPQLPKSKGELVKTPIVPLSQLRNQLYKAPCVLVMGSEDLGLSWKLLRDVNARVSIEGAVTRSLVEDAANVDSLNVSVATALLCNAFLGDTAGGEAAFTNSAKDNERLF